MKKFIIIAALLIPASASAQLGVGVRLGDLNGISVKKYMGNNAIEVSVGRVFHKRELWYNDGYKTWYMDQKYGYYVNEYRGYRSFPVGIQAHYLFNNNIKAFEEKGINGFRWYYGFGASLYVNRYVYVYRYKTSAGGPWIEATAAAQRELDFGVHGLIGLEYTFKEAPVSVFADIGLFMEILDDPFLFFPPGGAGVRYNF